MPTRRQFIKAILAGAAVAAVGPSLASLAPPADDLGIAIRFVKDYWTSGVLPCRIDLMYGICTVSPDLACRVEAA